MTVEFETLQLLNQSVRTDDAFSPPNLPPHVSLSPSSIVQYEQYIQYEHTHTTHFHTQKHTHIGLHCIQLHVLYTLSILCALSCIYCLVFHALSCFLLCGENLMMPFVLEVKRLSSIVLSMDLQENQKESRDYEGGRVLADTLL